MVNARAARHERGGSHAAFYAYLTLRSIVLENVRVRILSRVCSMRNIRNVPYHIAIEVVNKRCEVLKTLENLGVQHFQIVDVRSSGGNLTRHLVRMSSKQVSSIPRSMLFRVGSEGKLGGETSVWIDSRGCEVCSAILSHGSFLISGRNVKDFVFVYNFIVPSYDIFKNIVSSLESAGLKPKILEVGKFVSKGRVLTEKQERTLWIALRMGFFDYPRKIDTLELSRRLGIAPSTLSETKRRGIRRLLEDHFKS